VFAARTIREVAVCAVAAVTDNQIAATAAMPRSILVAKKFTLLSLSVILNRSLKFTGLGSSFKKIVPSVRPRFNSSTLIDVVSLLPPAPIDEISFFRSPIRLGMRVQCCNFRASSTQTHNGPVYAYYFDRAIPWPAHPKFGAFHTGEIPYTFGDLDKLDRPWEPVDRQISKMMMACWKNMAAKGDPNVGSPPKWDPRRSVEARSDEARGCL